MKILVLQPDKMNGVTWYRIKQLQKESEHEVKYLSAATIGSEYLPDVLDAADAYFIRLTDTNAFHLLNVLKTAAKHKPVILDIDDNYDIVDPLSDMYKTYGTKEVTWSDGQKLWEDGRNIDIRKNKARLRKFHKLMKVVTMITVTTEILYNYAKQFNDNVVIIPNGINFKLFPKVQDVSKGREFRILWAGGSSHYSDLIEIVPTLKKIMSLNPLVHFYMLGVPFKNITKDLPQNRVHRFNWISADGHGYRLATMDFDVGLAPLKDSVFNTHKSSVKYYEYSALKVPTIAKNIPPYSVDITHGKNGMLYETQEELQVLLQAMIDNPLKRIEMGRKAYEYVRKNNDIKDIAKTWDKMIEQVCEVFTKVKK